MIKKSNILSFSLGVLCTGLLAYIGCTSSSTNTGGGNNDSAGNSQSSANHIMSTTGDSLGDDTAKRFCGLPSSTLIDLIRNYRDEVWSITSDVTATKLDARFVEIDITQLEGFLKYARRAATIDGINLASVRLYYINYGGTKKTQQYLAEHTTGNVFEDFSGCHSVALVPVAGDSLTDPNRRDYYRIGEHTEGIPDYNNLRDYDSENQSSQGNSNLVMVPNYTCSPKSLAYNHGHLCPPLTGCVTNTLLATADNE